MLRRFLLIVFLFLPGVGYALPHANVRVIDTNLEVSFNVQASKMNEELPTSPVAVEISTLKSLIEVTERVTGKKIVYVGESHDQLSHHVMELEVIKNLHRRGKKLAIGMEMFQRPFQKTWMIILKAGSMKGNY
jgi:uncharacterized iron-regulated protein